MDRRIVCWFFINFFILSVVNICKGEEKRIKTNVRKRYEECIKNFNIDEVDLSLPQLQRYVYLLKKYFFCRAVRENDIKECNRLAVDIMEEDSFKWRDECRMKVKYFNQKFRFVTEAIYEPMSLELIEKCMRTFRKIRRKECIRIIEAVKNNDLSVCSQKEGIFGRNCRALIERKPNLASDENTKDIIYYLIAYENTDPTECEKINSEESLKKDCEDACKFVVSREKEICEQDKGFKKFREIYCREFYGK